ncbi:hypothetical protein A2U01_0102627, partial [Trifolium medium]|nr:hypothetical protein [Trifolium medium]
MLISPLRPIAAMSCGIGSFKCSTILQSFDILPFT